MLSLRRRIHAAAMGDRMAKRKTSGTNTRGKTSAAQAPPAARDVEARIVALAEQLGRAVGAMQARADALIDREAVARQISEVRDAATHLLEQIGVPGFTSTAATGTPGAKRRVQSARGRSGGIVDAPGKKHRGPMPSEPRAKAADPPRVTKMKALNAARRRG